MWHVIVFYRTITKLLAGKQQQACVRLMYVKVPGDLIEAGQKGIAAFINNLWESTNKALSAS